MLITGSQWPELRVRGVIYDVGSGSWDALPNLLTGEGAPSCDYPLVPGMTPVWTGSEFFVWGRVGSGSSSEGGLYDPATDSWSLPVNLNGSGAPSARRHHKALWTGSDVLVFGGGDPGSLQDGGLYNPSSDTWASLPNLQSGTGAPNINYDCLAVWTGTRMIAWGNGNASSGETGGVYDLATDTWLARPSLMNGTGSPNFVTGSRGFWTGSEMLVWGGAANAGLYDPSTDSWSTPAGLTGSGAPSVGAECAAVWTGSLLIVWSGGDTIIEGGAYNPATDSWSSLADLNAGTNAPAGRTAPDAVWTSSGMFAWGGLRGSGASAERQTSGGIYNPSTDTWTVSPVIDRVAPYGGSQIRSAGVWTGSEMIVWGRDENWNRRGSVFDRSTGEWSFPANLSDGTNAPSAREGHVGAWTGSGMIVFGGLDSGGNPLYDGAVYNSVSDAWTRPTGLNSAFSWQAGDRFWSAWTGSRLIVLTYPSNSASRVKGAIYDPTADSWTYTTALGGGSTSGAPPKTFDAQVEWTGTHLLYWTGDCTTSAWYDILADQWVRPRRFSSDGPPGARFRAASTWTGDALAVWGGDPTYPGGLADGGWFDADLGVWIDRPGFSSGASRPQGRTDASLVWTDSGAGVGTAGRLILWGGEVNGSSVNTGAVYDSNQDRWERATSTANAPAARRFHVSVWTGSRMLVWGGTAGGGGIYHPGTDSWENAPNFNSTTTGPGHLNRTAGIWTGQYLLVWGGWNVTAGALTSTGGLYDPATDTWINAPNLNSGTGAPTARYFHEVVWTGSQLIVWGGVDELGNKIQGGGVYDLSSDTWLSRPNLGGGMGEPEGRRFHSAVWTGTQMLVWGGSDENGDELDDGGAYNPTTDTWANLPNLNNGTGAPAQRRLHVHAWTGSELLVWSGFDGNSAVGDGGAYDPATDTWNITTGIAPTTRPGPENRDYATIVHGDGKLLIWGGQSTSGNQRTGYIYELATDQWLTAPNLLSGNGAPFQRDNAAGTWTGAHFLIWGGSVSGGGGYDPGTDAWVSAPNLEAGMHEPMPRAFPLEHWTGTEWVLFGGYQNEHRRNGGIYRIDAPAVQGGPEIEVRNINYGFIPSQAGVDLGSVSALNPVPFDCWLQNAGVADLSIGAVTFLNANNCTAQVVTTPVSTVGPGGLSSLLGVEITPQVGGAFSVRMEVVNNDADEDPYILILSGFATPPAPDMEMLGPGSLSLSNGSSLAMPGTSAGTPTTMTLGIRNDGPVDLTLGTIQLNNPQSCTAQVTRTPASPVPPTGVTSFDVEVTPAGGLFSIVVSVPSNDPNNNPFEITLTGTAAGLQPEIDIEYPAGTSVPDGGSVNAGTPLAGNTVSFSLVVRNVGNANLIISGASLGTAVNCNASITTAPGGTVTPSASTTVTVDVIPVAGGTFSVPVEVDSNDANEPNYTITIAGNAQALEPEIEVSVQGVGPVADGGSGFLTGYTAGTSRDLDITIANSGNSALTITGASVPSTTNCQAVVLSAPSSPVAAGAFTTMTVSITPGTAGAFALDVQILSNDSSEPDYDLTLSGSAAVPVPEIVCLTDGGLTLNSGQDDSRGMISVGAPTTLFYYINNLGTADLQLVGTPTVAVSGLVNCNVSVLLYPSTPILPSQSTVFALRVTVQSAAAFQYDLTIANNDPDESGFTIRVSGLGQSAPEILMYRDPGIPVGNLGTDDVGRTPVGTGTVLTYNILNEGTSPLTLGGAPVVQTGNPQNCTATVTQTPASPVSPGNAEAFHIEVQPVSEGLFSFTIDVMSNDIDEASYTFTVIGYAGSESGSAGGDDDEDESCTTGTTGGWLHLLVAAVSLLLLHARTNTRRNT